MRLDCQDPTQGNLQFSGTEPRSSFLRASILHSRRSCAGMQLLKSALLTGQYDCRQPLDCCNPPQHHRSWLNHAKPMQGILNVLEAVRAAGLSHETRVYQASTSELYGKVAEVPQSETTPFHPRSPYAVSKQFGFWIVNNYR